MNRCCLLLSLSICLASPRPQTGPAQPPPSLGSGISDLADGARAAAFLLEEGGGAGIDILSQFGQLLGRLSLH